VAKKRSIRRKSSSVKSASRRRSHRRKYRKQPLNSEARNRALHVLAHMRRDRVSLAVAARLEHTKPSTVLRHVGSALRQERASARFRVAKNDKFKRFLQIPTADGYITVPVRDLKLARKLSSFANAVNYFLRTGDESRLKPFKGKSIRVRGRKIEFLTGPKILSELADADALKLDQLYAPIAGGR